MKKAMKFLIRDYFRQHLVSGLVVALLILVAQLSALVAPGETVGVVGASGAGKSTIANLLYRFWDVQTGAVRIGAMDVRDTSIVELRSRLGIVSQETVLFHDSIYENLRLSKPNSSKIDLEGNVNDSRSPELCCEIQIYWYWMRRLAIWIRRQNMPYRVRLIDAHIL